jgi:HK97 family phage prohead protease
MNTVERRFTSELRAEGQGDEMAIGGYAALFNNVSHNLGGFKEQIAPSAFSRSLAAGDDVKALFNHDANCILGRTKSGTLALSQDERGLKWRAVLDPSNSQHRDIYSSVKRGDISDCSFAFTVPDGGDDWKEESGNEDFFAMRTLKDVNLLDVSAVTYPAYPGTSVGARMIELAPEVRSRVDSFKAKRVATKPATEKRDESIQDWLSALCAALCAKFPAPAGNEGVGYSSQFWMCETFDDFVIVQDCITNLYSKISYHQEADGGFLFGDPEPVEQTWVPSDRCKARSAEMRSHLDGIAAAHKAQADEHQANADAHAAAAKAIEEKGKRMEKCAASDGDCDDPECECQNRMSPKEDIWDEGDEEDEPCDGDSEECKLRKSTARAERRAKIEGARTKTVGGKQLTADKFAFVGDKDKTETWKLPIHDAAHVRNALARFNQTEGIPADQKAGVLRKIKAAAKKFGVEVSEENSRALDASVPMDADEVADKLRRARVLMLEL